MDYLRIITGQDKSLTAAGVRALLAMVRPLYALGVSWKNRKYDRCGGFHAGVPTISIGNLTLGGTGKTPMVIWLAGKLIEQNHRVAILSRGYHAKQQAQARGEHAPQNAESERAGASGTLEQAERLSCPALPSEATLSSEGLSGPALPSKNDVPSSPTQQAQSILPPLNDEGLEIQRCLPQVLQLQQPDRIASAKRAVSEFQANVLVLDDGFQHRRLHRDLDLVLLDATQPFGANGRLFPSGTLREPMESLRRADGIILTRADFLTSAERQELQARIFSTYPLKPSAFWAECRLRPVCFENFAGEIFPLDHFQGKRVGAFCGIGNPEAFFTTLERLGISLDRKTGKNLRTFSDHFAYGECGRLEMSRWRKTENLEAFLCTIKDIVKLSKASMDGLPPVFALRTELEFLSGESSLKVAVENCLRNH